MICVRIPWEWEEERGRGRDEDRRGRGGMRTAEPGTGRRAPPSTAGAVEDAANAVAAMEVCCERTDGSCLSRFATALDFGNSYILLATSLSSP